MKVYVDFLKNGNLRLSIEFYNSHEKEQYLDNLDKEFFDFESLLLSMIFENYGMREVNDNERAYYSFLTDSLILTQAPRNFEEFEDDLWKDRTWVYIGSEDWVDKLIKEQKIDLNKIKSAHTSTE
ncbi:MAG: hypothetical protein BAJALOKI2v1_530026 [Promethearchaeota archaeon]|nr:MAG: hypothetical protein BAJALOKI2v1_530026 [Candidatus Lokiarchaeota archaeon]